MYGSVRGLGLEARGAAAEPARWTRGAVPMALEEGLRGRDSWSWNFPTAMEMSWRSGFYAGEPGELLGSAVPGGACFAPEEGRDWERASHHPSIARSGFETYFLGQAVNGKIWKGYIVRAMDCLQCCWLL